MQIKSINKIQKIENSLNTLSPYVGKMRLEIIKYLIELYAAPGKTIYDPFAGSGTVLLEGWALGYNVVGTDLNYYAYILTLGKINPYKSLEVAESALLKYKELAENKAKTLDINFIPNWIKAFFDKETLKEIYSWVFFLKNNDEWFLLACLMGILHHQRPGFLSYPASNGAPYLRDKKYPIEEYPEMYQYKNVYEKLHQKVIRCYRNIPPLDYSLSRKMFYSNATTVSFTNEHFSTIITSPPYMKSLTYARDNRMRLWFLGEEDWKSLDKKISPDRTTFISMMKECFEKWASLQKKGDKCIIIIGDINITYNNAKKPLSSFLIEISQKKYRCLGTIQDPIPESKKVVKGNSKIKKEIILVFERI